MLEQLPQAHNMQGVQQAKLSGHAKFLQSTSLRFYSHLTAESYLFSVLLQTPLQTHSHRDGSQCNPGIIPGSIQESSAGDGLDLAFS